MNDFLGTNYKLDDFHEYYIDDILGDDSNKEKFYEKIKNKDLYKGANIFDNVVKVLEKLTQKYEV